MKKLIRLFAIAFCVNAGAQSPSFQWAKNTGGGGLLLRSHSIVIDASGNVYTLMGDGGGVISKLDVAGNFVWQKNIGGSIQGIAIDASGNIYATGYFSGTVDFDPSAGVYNLTALGSLDIFILKLDGSGNFVLAKGMGGTNDNSVGNSIAVDASGNIYTTGSFLGTVDFDPGAGVFNQTSIGNKDIFISKLDANGIFLWAKDMGGTNDNASGNSLAIDISGNVIVTGGFESTVDFDPSIGVFNLTCNGSHDIFILKLDALGNFVWAKRMGGTTIYSLNMGNSIVLDATGSVFTTGSFMDAVDFDPGPNVFNLTAFGVGNQDIFISKLDALGNFVWAKQIGSSNNDVGNSIVLDASGNIYSTGYYSGTVDFDPGAGTYTMTSGNQSDFISKLDVNGNFVWAVQSVGVPGNAVGNDIIVDPSANIFSTGFFYGTRNFDIGAGTLYLTSTSNSDFFIRKLSQNTAGIKENSLLSKIDVYPNPAGNNLTLINSSNTVNIDFFNVNGQLKKSIRNNVSTIDVSDLSNGLYFLKVFDLKTNSTQTFKIIKE